MQFNQNLSTVCVCVYFKWLARQIQMYLYVIFWSQILNNQRHITNIYTTLWIRKKNHTKYTPTCAHTLIRHNKPEQLVYLNSWIKELLKPSFPKCFKVIRPRAVRDAVTHTHTNTLSVHILYVKPLHYLLRLEKHFGDKMCGRMHYPCIQWHCVGNSFSSCFQHTSKALIWSLDFGTISIAFIYVAILIYLERVLYTVLITWPIPIFVG